MNRVALFDMPSGFRGGFNHRFSFASSRAQELDLEEAPLTGREHIEKNHVALWRMERATRFELATSTLGRLRSTN